jgi:predicted neuraminidase
VLRSILLATALAIVATAAPRSEFIYESAPFPSCHASTIVETKAGDLYAAWFGGTDEGNKDVAIWGSRRVKGGTWSAPKELVREPNTPTWNPVLFTDKLGVLWLYYKFGPTPRDWSGGRMSSRDGGQTWSRPEYLPAGILGPIKNKPLVLANGAIVSGTSVESYHAWTSWVERSTDNGTTWTKHGPIVYPGEIFASIQPTVVPLPKSKTLRMYVRTTPKLAKVAYADSKDEGRTWSELKLLDLPNPNSGIDAVGLKDGRVLLVYNHTEKGRSPLNVAVSSDGTTFRPLITLESERGEFSYPAVMQASDGTVHITYTWNRKKIRHVEIAPDELAKGAAK